MPEFSHSGADRCRRRAKERHGSVLLTARFTGLVERAAVAALALFVWHTPALAQSQDPVVTVAKPVVRQIVDDDEFVGRFEAVDEVAIRSRVGGYLQEVHFRDGTIVKKGDLLFTIDQRPFRTTLDQTKAEVVGAQTALDFARAQFERAESLSKSGDIPAATLDDRRREFLSAQARLDGARAAVTRAELDLEYTEIRSPLSGRVDRRLVSVGNLVQPDQTVLTTVVSLDPIHFYFDLDERQFLSYARIARERGADLNEGAGDLEVVVHVANDVEEPVRGTLDFAENRLDRESGTLRVRAVFPNPHGILQPGLFGRVNVPGSLPYEGIMLPDEAIGADQNRRIVYVVDDAGVVSAKPVRPGPRIDGYRVIRSGLDGSETVVINGLMRVRPGVKVSPELVSLPPVNEVAEAGQ